MTNLSKSPHRNCFQKDKFLERQAKNGLLDDPETLEMLNFYNKVESETLLRESKPEWKIDNLEYDLRTTDWILDKVRKNNTYAQNLYAALCNNQFIKNDVWPLLSDKRWHCSWRYAGGIIADMQQQGDYIDWYCSGIRDIGIMDDEEFNCLTKEQQDQYIESKSYVSEGTITDEVREDFFKLGWIVATEENSV